MLSSSKTTDVEAKNVLHTKQERKAVKSGLNLSEYTRVRLFGGDEKQHSPEMVNRCVVLCQDILKIAEEKYSCEDNSLLEEKVEKLWKILW